MKGAKEQRKIKILDIVIRSHIDDAEPVGSKYISEIMGVSSATIRNILAELEDDGYLEQPHTSAGRVPTEMAYRLYVNNIMSFYESSIDEARRYFVNMLERYRRYTDLIEHAAYELSKVTHYTSFTVYPMDHIYMDGAFHMLEQPEFMNIKQIKKLLKALDEKEKLLKTLNSYFSSGALKIHIGKENIVDGFEGCTLITASYKPGNKIVGGVGVIGPIRMDYKSVVPVVRSFADSVSRLLESI